MGAGEVGGEEVTLWSLRRCFKLCPPKALVPHLRLHLHQHQQEEGIEVEEGLGEVGYQGFLSALPRAVANSGGS